MNNLTMDKIDYWFLESAIEDVIGFSWIVPNRIGDIGINRKPLNISIDDMARVMQRLFQEGSMLAINPSDLSFLHFEEKRKLSVELLSKKGFVPSLKQIKNALKYQEIEGIYDNEELYYFLTRKGGELWEYFSHPKWEKYINYAVEETNIEIIGIDSAIIKRFLNFYHLLSHDSYNIYYPILDTQKWTEVIPYQCVYWKSFRMGHKVSCQIKSEKVDKEDVNNNKELLNQRKEAKNWYYNITKWYTNYYIQEL